MLSVGTKTIKTSRLILRQFKKDDAAETFKNYGSDEKVPKYINFFPWKTLQGTENAIDMHLEAYKNDPDFYGWAIEFEGKVIGSVGLFNVDKINSSLELGYSIGSLWWGKGIVTEAANAVTDYAKNEIKAHRVTATHHTENTASGKVMQKIGMEKEGILRDAQRNFDGSYSSLVLYSKIFKEN